MGPSHRVVCIDGDQVSLYPQGSLAVVSPIVVNITRLEVWETDFESGIPISESATLYNFKKATDRVACVGDSVRILSPLEALARCANEVDPN